MMDFFHIIKILKSVNYVDRTDCFETLLHRRYTSLTDCKGTGSSLYLRTLACFLSESINTRDVFVNLKIGKSQLFAQNINSYRVVLLDFTDFHADNYHGAIEYVKDKMSSIYKAFYDEIKPQDKSDSFNYRTFSDVLDIIDKTASVQTFSESLRSLFLQLRGYVTNQNGRKLAVLIDNMVQLETVAAENGYAHEMEEFLKSFIVSDVYKYCDFFLQISDHKSKHDYSWVTFERYLVHSYFTVTSENLDNSFEGMIVPKKCQSYFDYRIVDKDKTDWAKCVADGRRKVQEAKKEEERRNQEFIHKEKLWYAKELSPEIFKFSPNLGIRRKSLDKTAPWYAALNTLLKDIYTRFSPHFETNSVYQFLQKISPKDRIIKKNKDTEALLANLSLGHSQWQDKGLTNCWSNWIQVSFNHTDGGERISPGRPENIKVYAHLEREDIQSVFVESLRYLLESAKASFAAKVSIYNRADQMCYWISKKDFKHLENFFMPYRTDMEKSMPFVAYKGMLGISREFPGVDNSHNATQAKIIADYLKTVKNIDDVELEDMYNHYIAKWNADQDEEDGLCCFKRNTALSFIVLLDSLDTILSGAEVAEEDLLMSDDNSIWNTLANSYCWADVNKRWLH